LSSDLNLTLAADSRAAFFTRSGMVSSADLIAHAGQLSRQFSAAPWVINYCKDRYNFTVTLVAAALQGQCSLLLPGHNAAMLGNTLAAYPDAVLVADDPDAVAGHEFIQPGDPEPEMPVRNESLVIPEEQLLARVFTSGTTGVAAQISKAAGEIAGGAAVNSARFEAFTHGQPRLIVATVPPWHMYGLEWSVMVPLVSSSVSYSGPTLFPGDIAAAAASSDLPVTLVSTPYHLQALERAGLEFESIHDVISATAPLCPDLASRISQRVQADLHEVYGCTEAGSVATASPATSASFQFFPEFTVDEQDGKVTVNAKHLSAAVTLADQIRFVDGVHFQIAGRDQELIKVAGKRASLAALNQALVSLDSVEDGVMLQPEDDERLVAILVADKSDRATILARLAENIEASFVPRKLYFVEQLPRNETGKLSRSDLLSLLAARDSFE